ncbi:MULTISPECIES: BLUF domain-containing protein [Rhodomicrobium]|uniref:BLUF domain-containing protein n=1 Tax=Rhodomicrobium TaxID=1068 RepID=UPI000F7432B3|nr:MULTISPECIES: BLUF domain-containing protein [Rhodomicrobium]
MRQAYPTNGGGEPDFYRITYISSAKGDIGKAELDAILDVSRRLNARDAVGGLLLYHDGHFFQCFEGPREAAEDTFARIRRDPRHAGLIVLASHPVEQRRFRRWSMAFFPIDQLTSRQRQDFVDFTQVEAHFSEAAKAGDPTATLIESFVGSFRGLE